MTGELAQVAPPVAAVALIIMSPLLDWLAWRQTYESFYKRHARQTGPITPANLASGAQWAVDNAQVIPSLFLTGLGTLLMFPGNFWAGLAFGVTGLVALLVVAFQQKGQPLHRHAARSFVRGLYSVPQLVLLVGNMVVIVLVLLAHPAAGPGRTPPPTESSSPQAHP